MKRSLFCLWCILLGAVTYARQPCQVLMLNGDRFKADYLGQNQAFALFQVEWQNTPVKVHGKYIASIDLGRKAPFPRGDWEVNLGNNERIFADLISYDENNILLKPSWTKALSMNPDYLNIVSRGIREDELIYHVPAEFSEWEYRTRRGASQDLGKSKAGISAEGLLLKEPGGYLTELPAVKGSFGLRIRMRFPLLSPQGAFGLTFNVFPKQRGYDQPLIINFQPDQFSLRAFNDQQRLIQQKVTQIKNPLQSGRSYEMKIEFDRQEKRLRTVLDDEVLFEWEVSDMDLTGPPVSGELLFMIYRNNLSRLLVEEVFLYELGKSLPVTTSLENRELPGVEFTNGDFLTVDLQEIDAEGNWVMEIPETKNSLKVDPVRIQAWISAPAENTSIKRKANHVGIQLSGSGEYFVAELISGDSEKLILQREGISEPFDLPFSKMEVLRFNPYFNP